MSEMKKENRYVVCKNDFEDAASDGDYEKLFSIIQENELLRGDWSAEYSKALGNASRQGFVEIINLLLCLPPIRSTVGDGAQFAFREALRYGRKAVLEILFTQKAVHKLPTDWANLCLVTQALYNNPHTSNAEAAVEAAIYTLEHHEYFKEHQVQFVWQLYGNTRRMMLNANANNDTDWESSYESFCNQFVKHFDGIFKGYSQDAMERYTYDCRISTWKDGDKTVTAPYAEAVKNAGVAEKKAS